MTDLQKRILKILRSPEYFNLQSSCIDLQHFMLHALRNSDDDTYVNVKTSMTLFLESILEVSEQIQEILEDYRNNE